MIASFNKLTLFSCVALAAFALAKAVSFDTNFVELDASKLISTGENNYAVSGASLASNWKSISVNGDEVIIVTKDNQSITKLLKALTLEEKHSLDALKNSLTSVIRLGPFNVKTQTGLAKLTTFDKNGGTSTMGTGGGSSSSSSSSSNGGTSISKTGPNAFIVTKQDFPFKWHRVFVNDDVITIVYRNGRVIMMPQTLMRFDEKQKIVDLRAEVEKSSKAAQKLTQSLTQSMKNPMDFVNKALGGIFGKK